jgi:plastocyanin
MRRCEPLPASSWVFGALLLAGIAARADEEVRGHVTADGPLLAVVYASDLPARAAPETARATMKQQHLKFVPQILPVLQGTAVEFVNVDEMTHNIFSPSAPAFDLGTFGRGIRAHVFQAPGPHVILCNIHVEMVGWVLVLKSPAFATVETDGTFLLRLPAGRHRLVLWRPREPEVSREIEVPQSRPLDLDWQL